MYILNIISNTIFLEMVSNFVSPNNTNNHCNLLPAEWMDMETSFSFKSIYVFQLKNQVEAPGRYFFLGGGSLGQRCPLLICQWKWRHSILPRSNFSGPPLPQQWRGQQARLQFAVAASARGGDAVLGGSFYPLPPEGDAGLTHLCRDASAPRTWGGGCSAGELLRLWPRQPEHRSVPSGDQSREGLRCHISDTTIPSLLMGEGRGGAPGDQVTALRPPLQTGWFPSAGGRKSPPPAAAGFGTPRLVSIVELAAGRAAAACLAGSQGWLRVKCRRLLPLTPNLQSFPYILSQRGGPEREGSARGCY